MKMMKPCKCREPKRHCDCAYCGVGYIDGAHICGKCKESGIDGPIIRGTGRVKCALHKYPLEVGMVFKSRDKVGNFSKVLMFCANKKEIKGKVRYYVIFEEGDMAWYSPDELNIDIKTIRKNDTNIDFYGMV